MAINPLQAPIDYTAQRVDLAPALEGFGEAFQALGESYAADAERKEAARLKQQFADDMQRVLANPSLANFRQLMADYPDQATFLQALQKDISKERIDAEFREGFGIASLLENKKPELAIEKLQRIIEARTNSGLDTNIYKQTLDELNAGNVTGAQALVNIALLLADPTRFKESSDALITAAKVPDARSRQLLKLQQAAADLGLTKAQTTKVLVETNKLNDESRKLALELEALTKAGGLDPTKTFTYEEKLRKEWGGRRKIYDELQSTYDNIAISAKAQTGAGDIALITAFMKMLDPGSVVRETEFATGRDTAGLYDRLANRLQQLKSGQIFEEDSKQREEYVSLARQYLEAANKKANQEKQDLSVVVKNYKLNPENVFGTTGVEPIPPPDPAAAPVSVTTPSGEKFTFPDQQAADAFKQATGLK